jgi:hypothetical protein
MSRGAAANRVTFAILEFEKRFTSSSGVGSVGPDSPSSLANPETGLNRSSFGVLKRSSRQRFVRLARVVKAGNEVGSSGWTRTSKPPVNRQNKQRLIDVNYVCRLATIILAGLHCGRGCDSPAAG